MRAATMWLDRSWYEPVRKTHPVQNEHRNLEVGLEHGRGLQVRPALAGLAISCKQTLHYCIALRVDKRNAIRVIGYIIPRTHHVNPARICLNYCDRIMDIDGAPAMQNHSELSL